MGVVYADLGQGSSGTCLGSRSPTANFLGSGLKIKVTSQHLSRFSRCKWLLIAYNSTRSFLFGAEEMLVKLTAPAEY